MRIATRKGIGFGLTSGIITTLGLMVGLTSGTHSKKIVLGGILLIAIADTLSDALGIHISEESGSRKTTEKQIWTSTFATGFSKFIFALSFTIPVLLFVLETAVIVGIIWGFLLISTFSYYIAKKRKEKPFSAIFEHTLIAIIVVVLTYFMGTWINSWVI